ncbi:hypothetical protein mRhiFer1_013496 [Rhinolophus ferrumequinum]|uniref:Solute carrier family 66 member 1 n=1 Tax=Rhinolophus ferrumequinum TaxID=59479 RepID=A0A7J7X6T3_RHIFE|nr:hypothetical protein mRhiFer1_013496 [Rhinolophus ferrumequinum]
MVWKKLGSGNFSSCPNGSRQWIWDMFGECAQDGWDEASVGLGLVSILCFAASTFPQYIKACKTGNMDEALSLWFLLGWIGGDSCNLIGSFLADQLPLQTYTAVYYVLADLVMLSLYFHYKFKKRPSLLSAPINSVLLFTLGLACTTPLLSRAGSVAAPTEVFWGRKLLSVEPGNKPFTRQEIIGFVIGSVSSVLYLFSRLPQIHTNALDPVVSKNKMSWPQEACSSVGRQTGHISPSSSSCTGTPPPPQSVSHSSQADQDPGQAQMTRTSRCHTRKGEVWAVTTANPGRGSGRSQGAAYNSGPSCLPLRLQYLG